VLTVGTSREADPLMHPYCLLVILT
jgi:hypothetical protein